MLRELTDDRQPVTPVVAIRASGLGRPRDRVLDRDRALPNPIEVGHELVELPALAVELVAERPTNPQVVLRRCRERLTAASADRPARALGLTGGYVGGVTSRCRDAWSMGRGEGA